MYLFELMFSSFLGIYPGVGLLDHMATLFFVFGGTSILFSIVAAPVYIPTNSVRGFPLQRRNVILITLLVLGTCYFEKQPISLPDVLFCGK